MLQDVVHWFSLWPDAHSHIHIQTIRPCRLEGPHCSPLITICAYSSKALSKGLAQWSLSQGGCGSPLVFPVQVTSGCPEQLTRNKGAEGVKQGGRRRTRIKRKGCWREAGVCLCTLPSKAGRATLTLSLWRSDVLGAWTGSSSQMHGWIWTLGHTFKYSCRLALWMNW